jgi:hypothetical protein
LLLYIEKDANILLSVIAMFVADQLLGLGQKVILKRSLLFFKPVIFTPSSQSIFVGSQRR